MFKIFEKLFFYFNIYNLFLYKSINFIELWQNQDILTKAVSLPNQILQAAAGRD